MNRRLATSAMFLLMGIVQSAAAASDETRTEAMFNLWAEKNQATLAEFKAFLASENLGNVYPLHDLARTASDWKTCGGSPFELPPKRLWTKTKSTLALAKRLMDEKVMEGGEVVSAYRNAKLNACAGGSSRSSHTTAFALDLKGIDSSAKSLCQFHRIHGAKVNMGLSRYPSGRIHLDTNGYRTWGNDFTSRTSFCRKLR